MCFEYGARIVYHFRNTHKSLFSLLVMYMAKISRHDQQNIDANPM